MKNIFGVGVSNLVLALMAAEPETGAPTYSGPLEVASTNAIKWSPSTSSATADGDNKQVANISVVSSGSLTWTGWGTPDATYAAIYGHEEDESDGIKESFSDIAPYVGVGYVRKFRNDDGTFVYKAYFYYKAQAVPGDEEQTTQGTSLSLASTQITFNVAEPMGCNFRDIMSFDNQAAAAAWLAAKVDKAG